LTGGVIVIVALAEVELALTEVAVNVTVAGLGTVVGAVKVIGVPDELAVWESVPQAAPWQPVPESVQVTPLFLGSFWTVAVKF
jgi:hypothetical protein